MEPLDALYVCDGPTAKTLVFRINLGTPGVVDQVGFVHYLHEKFEARRTAIGRIHIAPHYSFGSVTLEFSGESGAEDAKAFCDENLTTSGLPGHAVRQAVEHADPRDRKAGHWFREILALPTRDAAAPTDHIRHDDHQARE